MFSAFNSGKPSLDDNPTAKAAHDKFVKDWDEAHKISERLNEGDGKTYQAMMTNGAILNVRFNDALPNVIESFVDPISAIIEGKLPDGETIWAPGYLFREQLVAIVLGPMQAMPKDVTEAWDEAMNPGKGAGPAGPAFDLDAEGHVINTATGERVSITLPQPEEIIREASPTAVQAEGNAGPSIV